MTIRLNPYSGLPRTVDAGKKFNPERIETMNKKFVVVMAIVAIAVTSAVAGMKNPESGRRRKRDVSHEKHY
jgi:hypothetical protein